MTSCGVAPGQGEKLDEVKQKDQSYGSVKEFCSEDRKKASLHVYRPELPVNFQQRDLRIPYPVLSASCICGNPVEALDVSSTVSTSECDGFADSTRMIVNFEARVQ